jgi:hypothetical protein
MLDGSEPYMKTSQIKDYRRVRRTVGQYARPACIYRVIDRYIMYTKRSSSDSAAKNAPAIISSIAHRAFGLRASKQAKRLGGFNLPIEDGVRHLSADDDAMAAGRDGDELILGG